MAPKSDEEIFRALCALADQYGIDLSDPERERKVLFFALRDGRVRLPSGRKRGRRSTLKGSFGLELVEAVEGVQREGLGQGRSISQEDAIEALRTQFPDKWGSHEPDTLKRRYYEAKHIWNYATRLFARFSQGSAENS
jgi:hypothetical protein